ncbi:hypothetical protein GOV13_02480 [Candidatus Pacearchaeota archaeon]|nr:hypothetical protein [Candidatus Pacearchaeota archaeon]
MKRLEKKHLEKIGLVSLVIMALLLIIIFLVRPTIIGYTTYKQLVDSSYSIEDYGKDINELEVDLIDYKANLSACNLFNEMISEELDSFSNDFSECRDELEMLRIDFSLSQDELNDKIDDLKNDLVEKDDEVNELESDYSKLAENLANNLCCKKKVDNPDINSYIVENNNIVCVENEGLEIEC